jgi:hypothetical protein
MTQEFVPYKQALKLKELGFDGTCYRGYDKNQMLFYSEQENGHELNYSVGMNVSAPLYQQAFRWFREKYNINGYQFIYQTIDSGYALHSMEEYDQTDGYFNTYEEAELACLKKLIEIAKKK